MCGNESHHYYQMESYHIDITKLLWMRLIYQQWTFANFLSSITQKIHQTNVVHNNYRPSNTFTWRPDHLTVKPNQTWCLRALKPFHCFRPERQRCSVGPSRCWLGLKMIWYQARLTGLVCLILWIKSNPNHKNRSFLSVLMWYHLTDVLKIFKWRACSLSSREIKLLAK